MNLNEKPQTSNNALLLAVQLPDHSEQQIQTDLEELASLTMTIGCKVVTQIVQIRQQLHPAYYIGKGKLPEIKSLICQSHIDLIIVDGQLSPNQGRNLERALKCMVWDRTQLILEIFANNAATHEAKKQIELAQLQYMLPRLVGMWAHLDRERGGIGVSRGTGETQIEKDRRFVTTRIGRLKDELHHVDQGRKTQKKRRSACLNVSLIGYTNAGKSTIMNALTDSEVLVEDKLFATLESTTRLLEENNRPKILLSDTVGFIKNLPHELVASFRSTLQVLKDADLLLHVVDISSPEYEEHIRITLEVLDDLQANRIPCMVVFNKVDQLPPVQRMIFQKRYPDAIFLSAQGGEVEALRERIVRFFEKRMETMDILLNYKQSHNLKQIYEWSRVDRIDYTEDGIHLTLTSLPGNLARIRHHIKTVSY